MYGFNITGIVGSKNGEILTRLKIRFEWHGEEQAFGSRYLPNYKTASHFRESVGLYECYEVYLRELANPKSFPSAVYEDVLCIFIITENAIDYKTGTLTLVYDHHKNDLAKKITNIQHEDYDIIVTSLHVHLDHDNCLEVLILKGDPQRVKTLSNKLTSLTGVKYGVFSGTSSGNDVA